MAVAHDIALTVDLKPMRQDDLAWDGHICVGQTDAVKLNLNVSLSEKVAGLLGCFKMTLQVAATREDGPSELLKATEITQDRIADLRGRRGEIRFVERTVKKGSGRYNDFLGPCTPLKQEKEQRQNYCISAPHVCLLMSGQGAQTIRRRTGKSELVKGIVA
jgi:hypothetical protein